MDEDLKVNTDRTPDQRPSSQSDEERLLPEQHVTPTLELQNVGLIRGDSGSQFFFSVHWTSDSR